ncbi:hypothetical protein ADT22_05660 [Clostridium botulinum]|nr:hypothetical protein ACP51_10720 [Clostridium botulinum]KOR62017.1 hypothetical protein ADT22_05660 [Clostridium botulinum]
MFMENESFKKSIVRGYCCAPFTKEFENHLVTIITAAGIITGTPILKSESDNNIKRIADINQKVRDAYREKISIKDNTLLPGNDGLIFLKDVKLVSGSSTFSFNTLNVFYDQVIAVTITPIE